MTRIAYAALAAMALLALAGAPARADDADTCSHPHIDPQQGQAAIDACTRLIESGSLGANGQEAAFANRGIDYNYVGQEAHAIEDFDEALRLKPDDAGVFALRGAVYNTLGQYARAIQDYDEAIRLKPDDAETLSNRGIVEREMGNIAAADADLAKAKALDPNVYQ